MGWGMDLVEDEEERKKTFLIHRHGKNLEVYIIYVNLSYLCGTRL